MFQLIFIHANIALYFVTIISIIIKFFFKNLKGTNFLFLRSIFYLQVIFNIAKTPIFDHLIKSTL